MIEHVNRKKYFKNEQQYNYKIAKWIFEETKKYFKLKNDIDMRFVLSKYIGSEIIVEEHTERLAPAGQRITKLKLKRRGKIISEKMFEEEIVTIESFNKSIIPISKNIKKSENVLKKLFNYIKSVGCRKKNIGG